MKLNCLLFFTLSLLISCENPANRPYHLLNQYSGVNFERPTIVLLKYKEEMSGITQSEGIIEGVFNMRNPNVNLLKKELLDLNYHQLPIREIDMGDGFQGNVMKSDSGYYKLDLVQNNTIIDRLVVFNLTQNKVMFYKLVK